MSSSPFPTNVSLTFENRAYIKMLGGNGLTNSSKIALLNANYAMARLDGHYRVKFTNENNRCAHEFIIDLAEFEASAGLKVMDFAKRLQVSHISTMRGQQLMRVDCRTLESILLPARGLSTPPCSCVSLLVLFSDTY